MLTTREFDVLELLELGLNGNEIADRLGISGNTVRSHMQSIYHEAPRPLPAGGRHRRGQSQLVRTPTTAPGAPGGPWNRARVTSGVLSDVPYRTRASLAFATTDGFDPVGPVAVELHCDVLIADNRTLFREALRTILEEEDGLRVVAEPGTAMQVVPEATSSRPDIALLNTELPGSDPLALAREPDRRTAAVPCLLPGEVSRRGLPRGCLEGRHRGVRDAWTCPSPSFIESVREVERGQLLIPHEMLPELIERLLHGCIARDEAATLVDKLSARERAVLALLADGGNNRSIASALFISPLTARTHIQNLMTKLGVHSRVEAAMFVAHNGLRDQLIDRPA